MQNNNQHFGKIPPQALDLEEAVLGAILIESYAFGEVSHIINSDSFYKEEHKEIFKACDQLNNKGKPIDILTVTEHLRLNGKLDFVGGAFAIVQLTQKINTAANITHHAYIIKEQFTKRELIRLSAETTEKSFDPTTDVFDLLEQVETQITDLSNVGHIKEPETAKTAHDKAIKAYESKTKGAGISVAENFDETFNGFNGGNLVIVAARPGMGKTAFMLEMARQTASNAIPFAIFSLEMSEVELWNRMIAGFEEIPLSGITNRNLTETSFEKFVNTSARDLPIYIDDTPSLSLSQLRAKATKLKKKFDIGCIVVDYLQLMRPPDRYKGNKTQEIGEISRGLKVLAKELEIPVIALSQLNRSVETRGGLKKPQMSDLRESGDIEQDADVILFLWRPAYYDFETSESGDLFREGETHVMCAKFRNGEPKTTVLQFNGNYQTFKRFEEYE